MTQRKHPALARLVVRVFGQNIIPGTRGLIRVGDLVEITERA